jgi:hypothetical protein
VARVASQTSTHPFAKAGVMLRASVDPQSPEAILDSTATTSWRSSGATSSVPSNRSRSAATF